MFFSVWHLPMMYHKKVPSTDHVSAISWYLAVVNFTLGTALFFHGFLLMRSELADISTPLVDLSYEAEYKRLVLLLVDGLSFDFLKVDPNGSLGRPTMPFTSRLGHSPHAFLAHFWADPPTTTLQRLKALTTGSMPTFIDASTNFGGTEVVEDNLVLQWKLAGRRMLFVGDDTWMGLFPNHFEEAHPYSSFNVKDLDTVDEAVSEVLLSALEPRNASKPWDIFIGHMLGIDHCGHTFGSRHPEMKRKVLEVDRLIRKVVDRLSADDVLVVLGDHGMTDSGDHGGDSPEELDAGLLVYSSGRRIHQQQHQHRETPETVYQVDLVPTLAHWTGIPVPFSNLGVLIPALLAPGSRLRDVLVGNFVQMFNYTLRYWHSIGRFPLTPELDAILAQLSASQPLEMVRNLTNKAILDHLHALQASFRLNWTRFDLFCLWFGVCLSANAVVHLLSADKRRGGRKAGLIACFLLLCQCLLGGLPLVFWTTGDLGLLKVGLVFTGLSVALINALLQLILITTRPPAAVYYIVLLGLTYFSNSFLVHELRVTVFLLQTLVVYIHFRVPWAKSSPLLSLAIPLVLLRLAPLLEVCREESSPSVSSCFPPTNPWLSKSLTKLAGDQLLGVAVPRLCLNLFLFWLPVLSVVVFGLTGRRSPSQTYPLTVAVLAAGACTSICWLLDASQLVMLDQNYRLAVLASFIHRVRSWFARLSLAFLAASLGILLPRSHVHAFGSGVTTTASRRGRGSEGGRQQLMVDWLQLLVPIHRSAWLCSSVVFLLLVWMTLLVFAGDGGVLALSCTVLLILVLWPLPKVDASGGLAGSPSTSQLWLAAVLACLTDNASFYVSGHQPTFSSIPWEAAFTAFAGDHTTHVLPTVMVLAHLFSGSILVACGLPLLAHRLSSSLWHSDGFAESLLSWADASLPSCGLVGQTCNELIWRLFVCKAVLTCLCCLAAGLLRRHLMVWKIFAPRLLFSVVGLIASCFVLLCVRLTVFCWTRGCDCRHDRRQEGDGQILSSAGCPGVVARRGAKNLTTAFQRSHVSDIASQVAVSSSW